MTRITNGNERCLLDYMKILYMPSIFLFFYALYCGVKRTRQQVFEITRQIRLWWYTIIEVSAQLSLISCNPSGIICSLESVLKKNYTQILCQAMLTTRGPQLSTVLSDIFCKVKSGIQMGSAAENSKRSCKQQYNYGSIRIDDQWSNIA